MDVKIKTEKEEFKFRVSGILINGDKVLGLRMCNNVHFCCPGGHIHLGEDSVEAMKREFKEEVGVDATPTKLLCVNENFFTGNGGRAFHELGFYYLMSAENLGDKAQDFNLIENDEGELKPLEFRWFKLDELDKVDFRPVPLKEKLMKKDFDFEHIINKD